MSKRMELDAKTSNKEVFNEKKSMFKFLIT